MPNPANTHEINALLADQLAAAQQDGSFVLERVLKDTEWERTEVVRDKSGKAHIRKYIKESSEGFGLAYAALENACNPALPQVEDVYRIPAATVVILEFLEGQTARQAIEASGPMAFDKARQTMVDICTGVGALHHMTPPLIHRDINPSNVMITPTGAKLIDFGIARRYDNDARRDTRIWGTPGYTPPEQFGLGQSDVRTDIYALGMLFWFLLTGKDPEPGLMRDIDDAPMPPIARKIIKTCIAWDPDDRYPTIAKLLAELGENRENPAWAAPGPLPGPFVANGVNPRPCTASTPIPQPASTPTDPRCVAGRGEVHAAQTAFTRTSVTTPAEAPFLPRRTAKGCILTGWRIACVSFVVFYTVVLFSIAFTGWRAAFPQDLVKYLAWGLAIDVFMLIPIMLLITNIGGVITRTRWLQSHRILKIVGIGLACFIMLCVCSQLLLHSFSAEYLAQAAAHGSSI